MTPLTRLSTRVYLFALAIVAVVAASVIFLPRLLFHSRLEQSQLRTISILVDDLGQDDPQEIQVRLDRLGPRLTGPVGVYDAAGRLVASVKEPVPPPPDEDEARELAEHGASVDVGGRLIGRTARGFVVVHQSPRMPIVTTQTGILWAIALALILGGALLFARSLARPLARLGDAATRFGAGETSARARLGRGDELGQVGRAFDDMADRIEHLLRAQRDLVADVSHELRTPLARLRVALELAADAIDEPAAAAGAASAEGSGELRPGAGVAAETLREIQADLDELERLVGDVLTAGRLDAGAPGALALQRRPVRVGDLAHTSANRFAQLHAGRSLHLQVPEPEATVACDPVLLRRAVDNLLDNAAKYSDAATTVDLTVRRDGPAIEVVVADHGVGMDDDELAHAFTPFWRADSSRTRGTGGVGLGLTLARRIARAHDGDIQLASARGQGTTATLRIPA